MITFKQFVHDLINTETLLTNFDDHGGYALSDGSVVMLIIALSKWNTKYSNLQIYILPKTEEIFDLKSDNFDIELTIDQMNEFLDLVEPIFHNSWNRQEFVAYVKNKYEVQLKF